MPDTLISRIKRSWNAFLNKDPTEEFTNPIEYGQAYSVRPDRAKLSMGNEKSLVNSIYTRIAIDVAAIAINHVKTDEDGRFQEVIKSGLNECLTLSANVDQTGRAFIQELVQSLLDEGTIAIAPIDTYGLDPEESESYDIISWRTGKIVQWYPQKVKLELYDERDGKKKELVFDKHNVAIIENPFYSVMNAPNSTLRRLVRKINLLDIVDEQSGSGKLDLIIQLPYTIKTDARRAQADRRRKDIEEQLSNTKYGIAYTDGTEKITQLNRSVENNLLKTVDYLTNLLYSQLGMTASVFDGTADEKTMLNYYNRTIEPILAAITDSMKRTFLSKTARSQGQSIMFFKDPFRLVPVDQMAEIADKFTRNEIMSSNEIRQSIGMKPSKDPKADELRNSNISQAANEQQIKVNGEKIQNEAIEEEQK